VVSKNGFLLGSFFNREECAFLRNVGFLSTDYTALYPGIQNPS
jgi:hypothetical protein